ncbi:hypothetical protein HJC23_011470 [Cyclotella cryptica]|uniref:Uncharacterized protein n=1 Tax=Cyclotella cryptica TaxID=29204 RepID=A0ABD3NVP9_9STRA|eukprot:CCRYP_019889-RA/>CCRYP_019889-RA protein AED:0.06 eAED:0.06 QI:187/1/1/1/1/1/2/240/193
MPFFGFGQRSSSAAVAAAAGAHHQRQTSLSMSSSDKNKNARIAEVRAQTIAMAQSGELNLSRSKTSSGHTRLSSSGHKPAYTQSAMYSPGRHIVAVEPDNDDSKHRRIDQGILDASREALTEQIQARQRLQQQQQQQEQQSKNQSWWSSALSYATPGVSPDRVSVNTSSSPEGLGDNSRASAGLTVTKKFRVP